MKNLNFICFSVNNWEKRKARKQQFMLAFSKREDVEKVLYVEPPLNFFRLIFFFFGELKTGKDRKRWLRALKLSVEPIDESKNLFIYTPIFFIPLAFHFQWIYNLNLYISLLHIKKRIRGLGFENSVLWLYHPFDYLILRWFKDRVLSVFDWAEEWAEYFIEFSKSKKEKIKIFEGKIIKNVDIAFVVSQKLLEKAKKINDNSYHLLDGTAYEVFQKISNNRIPEDIKDIKKPILGYLGTINERVDITLLEFISRKLPDISIVLIGNIHEQRTDVSSLKSYKNIHFLGGKKYEKLGNYTNYFNVCILPYRLKPSFFIFPTKVFDYLATGKPIITTNLPQLDKFKDYLYIADSKEKFVDSLKRALKENSLELSEIRLNMAKDNTWDRRAEEIIGIIHKTAF